MVSSYNCYLILCLQEMKRPVLLKKKCSKGNTRTLKDDYKNSIWDLRIVKTGSFMF